VLKGKYSFGYYGATIDFQDGTDFAVIGDGSGDRIALSNSETSSLYNLLHNHFCDGWVSCDATGPFPVGNGEDTYYVTTEYNDGQQALRFVKETTLSSIPGLARQREWKAIAWRPGIKPYRRCDEN